MSHAGQSRCELVVFFLRNRIEFMIVASSTIGGQAEECLTDDANQIFDLILSH